MSKQRSHSGDLSFLIGGAAPARSGSKIPTNTALRRTRLMFRQSPFHVELHRPSPNVAVSMQPLHDARHHFRAVVGPHSCSAMRKEPDSDVLFR